MSKVIGFKKKPDPRVELVESLVAKWVDQNGAAQFRMTNFWKVEQTYFSVCFQSMAPSVEGPMLMIFDSADELESAIKGMKRMEEKNGWKRKSDDSGIR